MTLEMWWSIKTGHQNLAALYHIQLYNPFGIYLFKINNPSWEMTGFVCDNLKLQIYSLLPQNLSMTTYFTTKQIIKYYLMVINIRYCNKYQNFFWIFLFQNFHLLIYTYFIITTCENFSFKYSLITGILEVYEYKQLIGRSNYL